MQPIRKSPAGITTMSGPRPPDVNRSEKVSPVCTRPRLDSGPAPKVLFVVDCAASSGKQDHHDVAHATAMQINQRLPQTPPDNFFFTSIFLSISDRLLRASNCGRQKLASIGERFWPSTASDMLDHGWVSVLRRCYGSRSLKSAPAF